MREEEKKQSSRVISMKRFFKKRWVFPAIYIASAAIILTGVLWYQSNSASDKFDYEATDLSGKKINDEPAIEVNRAMENFTMPVGDTESVMIQMPFYKYDGKKEEQEAALVYYNNSYQPNTGIDIAAKDGKTFDVIAALSGTVKEVKEDSLLGNVITIEHDKGIVTQYQSVKDISVQVGDEVEQGQALAMAGQSLYNQKAGTHLHFEIRKDDIPVNPQDYFNKPLSALQDADVTKQENTDDSQMTDEEKAAEEGKTGDSKSSDDKNAADDKNATDKNAEDGKTSDDNNTAEPKKEKSTDESGDTGTDQEGDSGKTDPTEENHNSSEPSSMNS